ncbi:hypothetical protein ACFOY4_42880 [Actinomadura syzygii]|uniref:Uncharacterized protein n=1 Tax=Actinomadura syzygii TaxID=1427538 RepID=A0A5D0U5N7_9ACTN|nr:hypothetical protein [Actinomadura syzygii]TYC13043.1 hypothetical protein FXF65_21270 [Actinomadura syzygii]
MENTDEPRPLEGLAEELNRRGWRASLKGDVLTVTNPSVPRLNDRVSCDGADFRWAWGQAIGPVTDIRDAADRIVYVLREVRT